ncbi:hypothetical protein K493DRAFT_302537 [Basidiobolus meristosporus CBS 931.73]|uniref:Uncharacterized protein n=1 Tax=Basidiobolus meristosporus CBS 931.73 TaxID=1314790 RepID=A0A1Y1Y6N5_9FUNG|nr:hypothetical protein K493DRAFT_302537 [Basidiobolus meristosporus CBS 931.73]|eukprot:ORX93648.1 hypothetical protein K493DRAFT_302537 [Basidiobolus meristosporus CBS 931.73]
MVYVLNPQKSVDSGFSTTSHAQEKSFLSKPTESQTSYSQSDADIEEIQIGETSDSETFTIQEPCDSDQRGYRHSIGSIKMGFEADAGLYDSSLSATKSSFDSNMTSSSYTYSLSKAGANLKGLFRSSFPSLKRIGKFDEKTLCSRDDNLKEGFDPYRALYAIKFDSFTSSVDLDTFFDDLKPAQLKQTPKNIKIDTYPTHRPTAKLLFYVGFLFFPAWVVGSFYLPPQLNITGEDYLWRRRNRVTCIILMIFSMALALAFIIVDPKMFGFSAITR